MDIDAQLGQVCDGKERRGGSRAHHHQIAHVNGTAGDHAAERRLDAGIFQIDGGGLHRSLVRGENAGIGIDGGLLGGQRPPAI